MTTPYTLPSTPRIIEAIEEATTEGGGADLTDADRLALYLQTLAIAASKVADRIQAGTAGRSQAVALKALSASVIAAGMPRPEAGMPCGACDLDVTLHPRGYNCDKPHPANVEAICPGCGATFTTADPIDPAARCLACVTGA